MNTSLSIPFFDALKTKATSLTRPENKHKDKFACPICRYTYDTPEQAFECYSQPVKTGPIKVGDLVIVSGKWVANPAWGISDQDPWLAAVTPADKNSQDHFDWVDACYPWFVVTSLWQKGHREVCSLVSCLSGTCFYGWNPTTENTHYRLWIEGECLPESDDIDCDIRSGSSYYTKQFSKAIINKPSEALRNAAKEIADTGIITANLL